MAGKIILIFAAAAFLVYAYTPWLKDVSFGWWAGIFFLAIAFNIVTHLIEAARMHAVIERQFWINAQVLIGVLIVGCMIAINWPSSRLGGGILFVFAVVSWVGMIARGIFS